MKIISVCLLVSALVLGGCESAGEGGPVEAQELTGYTVSTVVGTQLDGQSYQLRRANRRTWLYETGGESVTLQVTDVGDTFVEMEGNAAWTGRIRINLETRQVEVGDRDWSSLVTLPIGTAI